MQFWEGIHSLLQRGEVGGVYLVAGGRGTEATVLLLSTSVLSVQSVVIRNFVPPKFRKVKQPENGKVKQPTKYTIT